MSGLISRLLVICVFAAFSPAYAHDPHEKIAEISHQYELVMKKLTTVRPSLVRNFQLLNRQGMYHPAQERTYKAFASQVTEFRELTTEALVLLLHERAWIGVLEDRRELDAATTARFHSNTHHLVSHLRDLRKILPRLAEGTYVFNPKGAYAKKQNSHVTKMKEALIPFTGLFASTVLLYLGLPDLELTDFVLPGALSAASVAYGLRSLVFKLKWMRSGDPEVDTILQGYYRDIMLAIRQAGFVDPNFARTAEESLREMESHYEVQTRCEAQLKTQDQD